VCRILGIPLPSACTSYIFCLILWAQADESNSWIAWQDHFLHASNLPYFPLQNPKSNSTMWRYCYSLRLNARRFFKNVNRICISATPKCARKQRWDKNYSRILIKWYEWKANTVSVDGQHLLQIQIQFFSFEETKIRLLPVISKVLGWSLVACNTNQPWATGQ